MELIDKQPGISLGELIAAMRGPSMRLRSILRHMHKNKMVSVHVGDRGRHLYTTQPGWREFVAAYESAPHKRSDYADSIVVGVMSTRARTLIDAAMAIKPDVRTRWVGMSGGVNSGTGRVVFAQQARNGCGSVA